MSGLEEQGIWKDSEGLAVRYSKTEPPGGRKWRRTTEPLDEGEREEWKSWLEIQH